MKYNTLRRHLMGGGGKSSLTANVGDIVYKANGKLNKINYEEWTSSLGTPVGVVVVPSGFAPDGKAKSMKWGVYGTDTSLTNYTSVPTTNNTSEALSGYSIYGCLPSDKYTGTTSYVDPTTKYSGNTLPRIPSPYLGDEPNPAYSNSILIPNNALSDFDGKGNTDVLVALGSDYIAANAARNYKAAGAEEIEWYLPAMGELGYLIVRLNKIQAALAKVNSSQVDVYDSYESSSEYSSYYEYYLDAYNGRVDYAHKGSGRYVRPFAMLDF